MYPSPGFAMEKSAENMKKSVEMEEAFLQLSLISSLPTTDKNRQNRNELEWEAASSYL